MELALRQARDPTTHGGTPLDARPRLLGTPGPWGAGRRGRIVPFLRRSSPFFRPRHREPTRQTDRSRSARPSSLFQQLGDPLSANFGGGEASPPHGKPDVGRERAAVREQQRLAMPLLALGDAGLADPDEALALKARVAPPSRPSAQPAGDWPSLARNCPQLGRERGLPFVP